MAGDDDTEKWRAIEGCPYEVSSLGRVRRARAAPNVPAGKIIAAMINYGGYLSVKLCLNDRRQVRRSVHRLVCEAFHGLPPSPDHEARHRNGDRFDNRSGNLGWATPKENMADQKMHGTALLGGRNHATRLTEQQVAEIRRAYAETMATGLPRLPPGWRPMMAERYGVTDSHISQITSGRCWNWLPDDAGS